MNIAVIASWCAWGLAAVLLIWMLFDLIQVGQTHTEDFLLSAREGGDEILHEAEEEGRK